MESKFLTLNLQDIGKGLLVAVITAVLGFLYELVKDKGIDITMADLQQVIAIVVLATISYLSKNFLTNSEGQFGKAEKKGV